MTEYLERTTFIPKRHFASWLDKTPERFAIDWGKAKTKEKNKMHEAACRSAHLLALMQNDLKVNKVDDLEMKDRSRGLIDLKHGAEEAKPFKWQVRNAAGIEYYYIPVEYLPRN
jgi:hypothetical protein